MKLKYEQSDWLMIILGAVTVISLINDWFGGYIISRAFIFNASNAKEVNAFAMAMHLIFIPTLAGTLLSIIIIIVSFLRLKKFLILFLILSPYIIVRASVGVPELMNLDMTHILSFSSNMTTITSFLFVGLTYYTSFVWYLENYIKRKTRHVA